MREFCPAQINTIGLQRQRLRNKARIFKLTYGIPPSSFYIVPVVLHAKLAANGQRGSLLDEICQKRGNRESKWVKCFSGRHNVCQCGKTISKKAFYNSGGASRLNSIRMAFVG